MTPNEYIENCLRTENKNLPSPAINGVTPRLEHNILGIAGESGELIDAMKRAKVYGKPFDVVNCMEEWGDIAWFISIGLNEIGKTWEDLFEMNIAKLKARFPDKYSDEKALNRDLAKERSILETNEKINL